MVASSLVFAGGALSSPAAHPKQTVPPTSYVASPPSIFFDATGGSQPCAPGFICYRPNEMKAIYDVPAGLDGSGQTIILVDAYGSPTIKADLAAFDAENGLPDPSFKIIGPNGSGRQKDPNVQGWQVETSLDVEWAHAIAPGANIVLVVSRNDNAHAITDAEADVVSKYPGAIISQSFGTDETFVRKGFVDDRSAHRVYAAAAALGDTVLASTGDYGVSGYGDTGPVAWYPASDPLVTAVGGTEGMPYPDGLQNATGGYGGEEAWNESAIGGGATGGGPSQLFPSPPYQSGVTGNTKRTVPDVSYNASSFAGVVIILGGRHAVIGGTSAGSPQWAGIIALADQARANAGNGPLGTINAALYNIYTGPRYHVDFHDITSGDNTYDPSIPGFSAHAGYDLVTGIGTPDAAGLIGDLTSVAGVSAPSKLRNVTCQNQQLTGAYKDVTVKTGTWCDLLNATVTGDVSADRASGLGIVGTTIAGALHAGHTAGVADPSHPGVNVVCNSAVFGNFRIDNSASGAPWNIGGTACAGSPDITGSTGSVVANNFQFDGNAATANEVSNNTVAGDFECTGDAGVTGSGNLVVGAITGQCTATQLTDG